MVENAFKNAIANGLHPELKEAYRDPQRSADLHAMQLERPAADAWKSSHNYGLGFDVILRDEQGKEINSNTGHENWYSYYKQLASFMKSEGLVWYDDYSDGGDSGHFEFHPAWKGGTVNWIRERDLARQEAAADGRSSDFSSTNWLPYMWGNANAPIDCGEPYNPPCK